jgi:polygalacturonase
MSALTPPTVPTPSFDIRAFGAIGDGITLDTPAINAAITAAHASGGGTVHIPAGTWLSFSIRLQSHITLYLHPGAIILAADPLRHPGAYDSPEPNQWDPWQDFGHSHWHNSLIWGEDLTDISIQGPGLIHGLGLTRWGPGPRRPAQPGDMPISLPTGAAAPIPNTDLAPPGFTDVPPTMHGQGNKAIALKLCRNVLLRDFSILRGGHFALLATGVDDLTIHNLRVDTNRDGLDIDCCRNVHISNTSVNSPNDDAICLKSSFALGIARPTENVTITHCNVTGYDLGTFLDGTLGRTQQLAPDRDPVTGRIKCGTESNGGFKNITISHCHCERSRGLALETVDGGIIEDITITHITMREITTAPLFLRLGNRARGPAPVPIGALRRVTISHITATDVHPHFAAIIAGLPGHPIEDITLSNIHITYNGGGTATDATRTPPEHEKTYPEPSMFGITPAYGLYARHVRNLTLHNVHLTYEAAEMRPPVLLDDVHPATFTSFNSRPTPTVPTFTLIAVRNLTIRDSPTLPDTHLAHIPTGSL